ncbi:hypothetical protein TELCIR_22008 [Teladorsagia circumcincta]|uniref:Uncharacterized protein n=1 Tax=Teladorsagia circumcincta TaxID=45464 RepID=A0A2G9TGE5_TELCI|nr:hypothetical protein TELCIR_22008 [Teladorsagia circumcincta]
MKLFIVLLAIFIVISEASVGRWPSYSGDTVDHQESPEFRRVPRFRRWQCTKFCDEKGCHFKC